MFNSPSIAVLRGERLKCFKPFGASVSMNHASGSVKKLLTVYPCGTAPEDLSALMSLSAVPTRPADSISLSATNCSSAGTISFCPRRATIRPLSSVN